MDRIRNGVHHGAHSAYMLTYHMVFVVKRRRKIFTPEMKEYLAGTAAKLLDKMGDELIELNTDMDHLHILVSLRPDQAPATVAGVLKTEFSKGLLKYFGGQLPQWMLTKRVIWSRSYFVGTTGGVSLEVLEEYVRSQQTEEHHRKYNSR